MSRRAPRPSILRAASIKPMKLACVFLLAMLSCATMSAAGGGILPVKQDLVAACKDNPREALVLKGDPEASDGCLPFNVESRVTGTFTFLLPFCPGVKYLDNSLGYSGPRRSLSQAVTKSNGVGTFGAPLEIRGVTYLPVKYTLNFVLGRIPFKLCVSAVTAASQGDYKDPKGSRPKTTICFTVNDGCFD